MTVKLSEKPSDLKETRGGWGEWVSGWVGEWDGFKYISHQPHMTEEEEEAKTQGPGWKAKCVTARLAENACWMKHAPHGPKLKSKGASPSLLSNMASVDNGNESE